MFAVPAISAPTPTDMVPLNVLLLLLRDNLPGTSGSTDKIPLLIIGIVVVQSPYTLIVPSELFERKLAELPDS